MAWILNRSSLNLMPVSKMFPTSKVLYVKGTEMAEADVYSTCWNGKKQIHMEGTIQWRHSGILNTWTKMYDLNRNSHWNTFACNTAWTFWSNRFYARSQNCEKRLLVSSCPSVRPSVWLSSWNNSAPTGRILWNLIFEYFSKICWENSSFIS